jgi:hypothetical protein
MSKEQPKVIYRTAHEIPLYVCPELGIKKKKYLNSFEAYWMWAKEQAVIFDEASRAFVDWA